jgi:hypothetical protein
MSSRFRVAVHFLVKQSVRHCTLSAGVGIKFIGIDILRRTSENATLTIFLDPFAQRPVFPEPATVAQQRSPSPKPTTLTIALVHGSTAPVEMTFAPP